MSNTIGNILRLTTFGESHGDAIGGIIDGFPVGIDIDMSFIQHQLDRRRPGQSGLTTQRNEMDQIEFLSGIFEGKSTGAPIGFIIRNTNQNSHDYDNIRSIFRPSHADYTYLKKYGFRDYRGGGRASARITLSRCVCGALAMLALRKLNITIKAYTSQVGQIELERDYRKYNLDYIDDNAVRCPDPHKAILMENLIMQVKKEGDTIGGVITCIIKGCPIGLGEPEFGKLHAQLGNAMLSINAAKGFEYGDGFDLAYRKGSEINDLFADKNDSHTTLTNHSGGIQGGISNGEDIFFRVAFKPVATILKSQTTIDIDGNSHILKINGRHDPCVLPRAVPIVESMASMVILDNYLANKTTRL